MSKLKEFLVRKDIVISPQRYLIDALGAMAQGLFASLLIGTIIKTVGQQTGLALLVDLGGYATAMSGPAMACAIGWALHCPPLVLFSLITVGYSANALGGAGGPLAVLIIAIAAAEPGIEMMLFSVNPAFDMMPASDNLDDLFGDYNQEGLDGINADRAELYALAEQTGTGITVMKGYAGGRLLDAATSPFGVALTPVQCIHYALTRPAVASIMVGFTTPEHVAEAVAYETAGPEERDYASVLAGAPRHAYYGQCTYCGHCAPCPNGIDIPTVNKFYDLAVMQAEVPDSVREHYRALDVRADACIACHACEGRCPFGVKVAEKMAQAAELFGC